MRGEPSQLKPTVLKKKIKSLFSGILHLSSLSALYHSLPFTVSLLSIKILYSGSSPPLFPLQARVPPNPQFSQASYASQIGDA